MTTKFQGRSVEITHESEFLFREHQKLLAKDGYNLVFSVKHPDGTYFARMEK